MNNFKILWWSRPFSLNVGMSANTSKSKFTFTLWSKKHYLWKFDLDGRTHILELFNSQLSGKKKVLVNGLVVCER